MRLAPGESTEVSGYAFRFDGTAPHLGPNYRAVRGTVQVLRDGEPYAVLHPEKRTYLAQAEPMTEAAVEPGFTRDLYVALGEPVGTEGAWTMRVQYKAAGAVDLARAAYDGDRRPSRRRGSAVPTRPASCHEPGRGERTCARLRLVTRSSAELEIRNPGPPAQLHARNGGL